jgi:two-component system response regulator YesN
MLTVLIADDEYFIRQRLKRIIDWETLQLQCVGESENGKQVLDLVCSSQVDILLLDINMPVQSGIDVLEYIYHHDINTKIIFLTGYSDFEYAQKAIKYQAVNYLIKPIDKESLENALLSCKNKILSARQKQEEMDKYYRYLRRSYLYKIAADGRDMSNLFQRYPSFLTKTFYCFLGVYCDEKIESSIESLTNQLDLEKIDFEVFQESESITMVQFYYSSESDYIKISSLCGEFIRTFSNYIFLSLGESQPIQTSWCKQYQLVLDNLTNRYFYPQKQLIRQHSSEACKIDRESFLSLRQNIMQNLNSKNKCGLEVYLKELFRSIEQSGNPNYLTLTVTEILIILNVNSHDSLLPEKNINIFAKELIEDGYSLSELEETIKSFAFECIDRIFVVPSDAVWVKKITEYILDHFTESDLSVKQISVFFNLNAAYMGNVFKKITGQSVVQYITALRMEKAMELLLSKKYKIVEVAEKAGYSDVFYFSKKFKKIYGCSPKNYCNSEEI